VRAQPYILLALLALIWGAHFPISKIALRDVPPFTYGVFRVSTGLMVVVALLATRRRLRLPDRHDIPVVLSVGIGQMGASIALMNLALTIVAAGRSSVLLYTMPVWVAIFQIRTIRAGRQWRQIGGVLLGITGIALLLNPSSIAWGTSGQLLGSAALLLSASIWALTTIQLRHHVWHGNPLDLEPWELLVALVPLLAGAIVLESGDPIRIEPTTIAAILYSGPLATALAYWLSQSISRSLSPIATTMGFLAVPVVGLAGSWLMLGEPLTALDLAGAAATFLGIAAISLASGSGDRSEAPLVDAANVPTTT
jgi:drug/metabolite transporter (DMT)-like permease